MTPALAETHDEHRLTGLEQRARTPDRRDPAPTNRIRACVASVHGIHFTPSVWLSALACSESYSRCSKRSAFLSSAALDFWPSMFHGGWQGCHGSRTSLSHSSRVPRRPTTMR